MPVDVPQKPVCVICECIAGGVGEVIIEESELTLTILTDRQFEVGQAIVVTRRHAPTFLELTDEESMAVMQAARRLAKGLVAAFDPPALTIFQNNGVLSGQSTPHFHLHLVPRRPDSNWGLGPPPLAKLEEILRQPMPVVPPFEERNKTGDLIRRNLRDLQ
jgi:diadenosine tetraphosphate (Ap4A) HIT family hydrolase